MTDLQQAKHDLLSNKHTAETVRQHLKYDSLAGRHLELQQDYEALLKDFKNQQRVYRAARSGPKVKVSTAAAIHRGSHTRAYFDSSSGYDSLVNTTRL